MTRTPARRTKSTVALLVLGLGLFVGTAYGQDKKPNILIIWGDDIGQDNISAYHRGLMGGTTPNIDRLAKDGAMFTDAYAVVYPARWCSHLMLNETSGRDSFGGTDGGGRAGG